MSGKSTGGRTTGKTSAGGVATTVDQALIEAIAANSLSLPEIKTYSITATVSSDTSITLTHNLGVSNYLVQLIDSSGDNILLPFTRTSNTAVFHFGTVTVEESYTVIIVQ
jgi:hypothetical protein